jgi:hypothetical protein
VRAGCRCLTCRLEEAVLSIIADPNDEPGQFKVNAEAALPALVPIMGVLLAAVPAQDLEATWRLMLDARCRALDLAADAAGNVCGRG